MMWIVFFEEGLNGDDVTIGVDHVKSCRQAPENCLPSSQASANVDLVERECRRVAAEPVQGGCEVREIAQADRAQTARPDEGAEASRSRARNATPVLAGRSRRHSSTIRSSDASARRKRGKRSPLERVNSPGGSPGHRNPRRIWWGYARAPTDEQTTTLPESGRRGR
jgi:hypothetical protein